MKWEEGREKEENEKEKKRRRKKGKIFKCKVLESHGIKSISRKEGIGFDLDGWLEVVRAKRTLLVKVHMIVKMVSWCKK